MRNFVGAEADDCQTIKTDGDQEPIVFNGRLCLPAGDIYLLGLGATDELCTGGKMVMLRGGVGMHQNMQPDAMRGLATALVKMAELAEANATRLAGEALARATGKSRP